MKPHNCGIPSINHALIQSEPRPFKYDIYTSESGKFIFEYSNFNWFLMYTNLMTIWVLVTSISHCSVFLTSNYWMSDMNSLWMNIIRYLVDPICGFCELKAQKLQFFMALATLLRQGCFGVAHAKKNYSFQKARGSIGTIVRFLPIS